MFEAIFIVWFLGGLVAFGVLSCADLVRGPRVDGWFNLAAAVIWPAVAAGALLHKIKGRV